MRLKYYRNQRKFNKKATIIWRLDPAGVLCRSGMAPSGDAYATKTLGVCVGQVFKTRKDYYVLIGIVLLTKEKPTSVNLLVISGLLHITIIS